MDSIDRQCHFLEGVNLAGGTPLVEWVECLSGVDGTPHEDPFSLLLSVESGVVAPVELIGSVEIPILLPLS